MPGLDRFLEAQRDIYDRAHDEIVVGAKQSHWMWFIFPQIAGLGHSANARFYALSGLDEARDYLAHPILGKRLEQCTDAMLTWAGKKTAEAILGHIDALKFRSSMTLFDATARSASEDGPYADALTTFYEGQRDPRTLDLLDSGTA